jgi:hypothetical protein
MSDDNCFVRPRLLTPEEGGDGVARATVPDAQSGLPLPADGAWKPRDQFWTRRLRDRDVEETTPPSDRASAAAPAEVPATKKPSAAKA